MFGYRFFFSKFYGPGPLLYVSLCASIYTVCYLPDNKTNIIMSEQRFRTSKNMTDLYNNCTYPLQALTQSDTFLNKLGVVKEIVDDEAVSAQVLVVVSLLFSCELYL